MSTAHLPLQSRHRSTTGTSRRIGRTDLVGAEDRREAERTIPRGTSRSDDDPAPAVDRRVWTDHVAYARTRDPRALDRLVEEYEAYAHSLARRLYREQDLHDDLDQVALEALVVALHRFDPGRGIPFPAFATPTILGALRRHYRDLGWSVRVPRRVHEFAVRERDVADRLAVSLGRSPTSTELAEAMGVSLDSLLEAQDALHARRTLSIESGGPDDPDGPQLATESPGFLAVEDRHVAAEAIATLDEPARRLLYMYFFEERSQSDIAAELGVSQMQVSRLLSAIIRRLRSRVVPEPGGAGGATSGVSSSGAGADARSAAQPVV